MISPHEFYLKWNGKGVDYDGYCGYQCWDLFAEFCHEAGYTVPHCIYSGGVKDMRQNWLNNNYNMQKNFDSVAIDKMQDGDWMIWGSSQGGGYGHVAMFRKYNDSSSVVVLGQNQGGLNGTANQINISTSGTIIVLRPKCYVTKSSTTTTKTKGTWNENGIVKVGSRVKSVSCAIQGIQGNCVKCNALGGLIPLAHISEASDTKDGKCDNYLATTKARIYLDECTVEAIDQTNDLAKVHGYWVKCKPLMVKE